MQPSHRDLAAGYAQLAQQLDAGIAAPAALRQLGGRRLRPMAAAMAGVLEGGGSWDDALEHAGAALPDADRFALAAAAGAGRVPSLLRQLAGRHRRLAAAQLRLALACAYPLALLHFGLLLLPIIRLIDWQTGFHWSLARYLRMAAVEFVPLWLLLVALYFFVRRGGPRAQALGRWLPGFRGYLRAQGLADLTFLLGSLTSAGVAIGDAWSLAGLVSSSPALKAAAERVVAHIGQGQPPGTLLGALPGIPAELATAYRTAELTGQLDDVLFDEANRFQEQAGRALLFVTVVYPALVFLIIAVGIAYTLLSLYAGYLDMISKMAE